VSTARKRKKTLDSPQQGVLFGCDAPPVALSTTVYAASRLYYATNASNLRGILSSGLIRPRTGWPKYAPDFQEQTPGYIPLFHGGVPRSQFLERVTQHDQYDLPVILEISPASWALSDVLCLHRDGSREPHNVCHISPDAVLVLLRGVIPLASIARLHFRSETDRVRFTSDCAALANTRPDLLPSQDDIRTIPDIPAVEIPPTAKLPPVDADADRRLLRRIDSVGGVLAALTRVVHGGGYSLIRREFAEWHNSGNGAADTSPLPDDIAAIVSTWIRGTRTEDVTTIATVLLCTLDYLASPTASSGITADGLLSELTRHPWQAPDREKQALAERLEAIRATVVHDADTLLFGKRGSPVLRGLLLFLLDSDYRDKRRPPVGIVPDPQDLLIAEILRGALKGWSRLPVSLRGDTQAELAITRAMARLCNVMPGAIKLGLQAPTSEPDELVNVVRLLREIADMLAKATPAKTPRQLLTEASVQELDIRVRIGGSKRISTAAVTRLRKTVKNKTTDLLQVNLPGE
jgi:hypothetical protein